MWVMNESDQATLISPHDPVTGEYIFLSRNNRTGQVVRINMEQLVREVERLTHRQFMYDTEAVPPDLRPAIGERVDDAFNFKSGDG